MSSDIILVVGQNCVGKTLATSLLYNFAIAKGIPIEKRVVSDSSYLFEQIEKDDSTGGLHHYHTWSKSKEGRHSHKSNEEKIPFILNDNTLIDRMFLHFFAALSTLPDNGCFWLAEWAGGKNINSSSEPASKLDVSFERIERLLKTTTFPVDWLLRIKVVIHIAAINDIRYRLFINQSTFISIDNIKSGRQSPVSTEAVLNMYGIDDLDKVSLFKDHNIPVYRLENNNDSNFFIKMEEIAKKIFISS
jgi:hypothetical protein